jgi:gamma-glutamylcyclotransferase (GGCT)/AIG2-like uncharacterized protein YtfP
VAPPLHFFFYGTLIAGSGNAAARAVHARLRPIGRACLPGALWAIPDAAGWYPALVAGPALKDTRRQVRGVLYAATAEFTPEDLARLDEWEDYRPAAATASLYLREEMQVTGADGIVTAQVYRTSRCPQARWRSPMEISRRGWATPDSPPTRAEPVALAFPGAAAYWPALQSTRIR